MTCIIPSQSHNISLFLMPVFQLIYSSSVEAYLLWKCCYFTVSKYVDTCSHKAWIAWDILLVILSVSGNLCNKCPKWLLEQNSSYSDYLMRSLVSIKQQRPRRPCDNNKNKRFVCFYSVVIACILLVGRGISGSDFIQLNMTRSQVYIIFS